MNIFVLDENVETSAVYHCDKHVVKMILEYAQILSTAHRVLDVSVDEVLYKKTHVNHPCSKWCRENSENYTYLYNLFVAVSNEYTFRYEKIHKTFEKLKTALKHLPKNIKHSEKITKLPRAMPDDCKISDNVIECYRYYYNTHKKPILKYTKREKPNWIYE